jgi:hypothetical protein
MAGNIIINNGLKKAPTTILSIFSANVEIFLLSFSLYFLFSKDYVIINEEILLCVCFTLFVIVAFASAGNQVFKKLQEKPEDIKSAFFASSHNKLKNFSEKNALMGLKSEKPAYIYLFCYALGFCESFLYLLYFRQGFRNALIFRLDHFYTVHNACVEKSGKFFTLWSLCSCVKH